MSDERSVLKKTDSVEKGVEKDGITDKPGESPAEKSVEQLKKNIED